jgi:hypothetical protein
MPTYTLKNIKTGEHWDVKCSFHELAPMLEDDNVMKVLAVPKIVSGVGNLHSKVPDGFKDKLKDIKKKSGAGNTIKI